MGRIADQGGARGGQLFGQLERERIDEAWSQHRDVIEEVAEPSHQMRMESLV